MEKRIFYSHKEELWNAWSHAAGIVLGVVCCTFFLYLCYGTGDGWAFAGVLLYMIGMLMSYISSTVYHSLNAWSKWKERFRKLDHASIYWHIAGSYSPIILICLRDQGYWEWIMFVFVWSCAIAGTLSSFHGLKKHSNIETLNFIAMGLSLLIAIKPLLDTMPLASFLWVLGEGVCFITGAAFYSLRKKRYMHTVFHFFVLGGSVCHIIAVWYILAKYL